MDFLSLPILSTGQGKMVNLLNGIHMSKITILTEDLTIPFSIQSEKMGLGIFLSEQNVICTHNKKSNFVNMIVLNTLNRRESSTRTSIQRSPKFSKKQLTN